MRSSLRLGSFGFLLWSGLLTACQQDPALTDGMFTDAEMATIRAMGPLPAPDPDPTNRYANDSKVALFGQKLFFDPGYSGAIVVGNDGTNGGLGAKGETGKVSCRSCHLGDWMIDTRSMPNGTSLGIDWFIRNSPSLVNVTYYTTQFGWVGYNDDLWGKCLIPAEFVMGTDRSGIVHYLYKKYKADYNALFSPALSDSLDPAAPDAARFPMSATPIGGTGPSGIAWKGMTAADQDVINRAYANFGKSLAAYLRQLVSRNSPFDRYVGGDLTAIGASAKRGLKLFIGKAACNACHSGMNFTDEKFHNTGVPQVGAHVLGPPDYDSGRYGGIDVYRDWDFKAQGQYSDDRTVKRDPIPAAGQVDTKLKGAFRTKGIRNVAMTAPYMHTGHIGTLKEVVQF